MSDPFDRHHGDRFAAQQREWVCMSRWALQRDMGEQAGFSKSEVGHGQLSKVLSLQGVSESASLAHQKADLALIAGTAVTRSLSWPWPNR